jgi:hypothetical protein
VTLTLQYEISKVNNYIRTSCYRKCAKGQGKKVAGRIPKSEGLEKGSYY